MKKRDTYRKATERSSNNATYKLGMTKIGSKPPEARRERWNRFCSIALKRDLTLCTY